MFSYELKDDVPELSPEEYFKINYFLVIVDAVRMSCHPRFEALKSHENTFGFMYHINDILQMNDELLMKKCKDLEVSLSQGENHDIEEIEDRKSVV